MERQKRLTDETQEHLDKEQQKNKTLQKELEEQSSAKEKIQERLDEVRKEEDRHLEHLDKEKKKNKTQQREILALREKLESVGAKNDLAGQLLEKEKQKNKILEDELQKRKTTVQDPKDVNKELQKENLALKDRLKEVITEGEEWRKINKERHVEIINNIVVKLDVERQKNRTLQKKLDEQTKPAQGQNSVNEERQRPVTATSDLAKDLLKENEKNKTLQMELEEQRKATQEAMEKISALNKRLETVTEKSHLVQRLWEEEKQKNQTLQKEMEKQTQATQMQKEILTLREVIKEGEDWRKANKERHIELINTIMVKLDIEKQKNKTLQKELEEQRKAAQEQSSIKEEIRTFATCHRPISSLSTEHFVHLQLLDHHKVPGPVERPHIHSNLPVSSEVFTRV
ncbi:hypothetical protein WMY93_032471 [Mugilogobius chulae]|uniref:Uncharacterized protein n=1 Tax=Mugilogobius chulae TaxID=88201 RepID=A0AAW0ML82_9GOBI